MSVTEDRTQNDKGRDETEDERADRKWQELIQEVRIAQMGVQIMFGFLLTVVFTPVYRELGDTERTIYIFTVVVGAAATGALIGPVALHRMVSGHQVKPHAVRWAARLTFVGLFLLLVTMAASLLLILRVATHDAYVPYLVSGVVLWYLVCWYGLPLWARHRYTDR
ncbi:DUF6328 family protein [Streptomyces sp. NPDC088387]|uniref:DUF6328 family protein n=1 Tax=Streptomyces sp. NPDC088387 TaxID=3365859 RepID=UPI00382EA381